MPRSRVLGVLSAGVFAVASLSAVTAPTATAYPGTSTLTVFFKAPRPAALSKLAAARGLTRAQRLAALATLVPSTATRSGVANSLRGNGFRVIDQTSWSITVTGAAATAHALFGDRPAAATGSRAAARVAIGALPRIPNSLSSGVAAVFPTAAGPAAFHHSATADLTGADFRNAYAPAGAKPSSGQNDKGATIATLQLANFYGAVPGFANSKQAKDLASYAREHHLANPVGTPQWNPVKVDNGPSPSDDQTGGDVEVNLDQQSILSTAPTAKQQPYFAPNTAAGFDDVFASVYDDVVGTKFAKSRDPHIIALSTSWGQCESMTGYKMISTLEPILQSVVAAGVTVFAAAGDYGIYDCGYGPYDTTPDVDYPASSPSVVAVGGSYLHASASRPNTGRNWAESAWTCRSSLACQGDSGGSGGGQSGSAYAPNNSDAFGGFPAPVYQRQGIDNAPFRNNAKRLVPDITADGDPQSGFEIYSSDPTVDPVTHHQVIGGTSLAAPISAAQLTNALADAGRKTGVGQIHGALYSAYRSTRPLAPTNRTKVLRDITAGANGYYGDRGSDPSVAAQPGYDTVSGVGAVLWPALIPYLFDNHRPSVTAVSMRRAAPYSAARWRTITAAWTISRAADLRLLGATHVTIRRLGSATPVRDAFTMPPSGSYSFAGLQGATYVLTVVGRDVGYRQSTPRSTTIAVPVDDSRFSLSRGWQRVAGRLDVAGSHVNTTTKGASATVARTGRTYWLRLHVGPGGGVLGVFRGGTRIATINTAAPANGLRTVRFFTSSVRALRTFRFANLGGKRVNLDAMSVQF
jgi:kumamolisin